MVTTAIAESQPDVVYSSQQQIDCAMATRAAQTLGVPQVIHLHYNVGPWLGPLPLRRLVACDHVIAVSDFIRNQVLEMGVSPGRVTTVHNTMAPLPVVGLHERSALRVELGIPIGAVVIGQVCRLDLFKGLEDTLHSFRELARDSAEVFLVFIGDGPLKAVLHQEVAKAGLSSRVRMTGSRPDVPRLLPAFDVFSHPSLNDPCPLAVMEASAAGLPVVAWESGGIPEIVEHGATGLLVPVGNRASLTQATKALVQSSALRSSFGAAARMRLQARFAPSLGGERFATVIAAAAAPPRHATPR